MAQTPTTQAQAQARPSLHRGFTLLEVMIAMSIFAIMGVASYQLLSGEITAQSRLQQRADTHDHWQRSMMFLTRDLRQAIDRDVRQAYGEIEESFYSDGQSLHITRQGWVNPLKHIRSDLQRVEYSLQYSDPYRDVAPSSSETTSTGYVRRQFWRYLDRAQGSEPIEQSLFTGVNAIEFRFFHQQKREWLNQWPASNDDSSLIPQAIEVILISDDYGEVRRVFSFTPTTDAMIQTDKP